MDLCNSLERRIVLKKYSLSYKYLLGILMGTYILVLVFLNMITPIKRFSETENRDLEQRPAFSFDNLFHGRFTKEYEKYIEDQFFIRDMWIGIKTDCERILLKNESNGVFLSKNNYLIQSFLMPSDQNFKAKIDTINQIAAQAPLANKYLMMVPTTAEILKDDLPAYAPNDSESAAIKKTKELLDKSITFVDVSNTLTTKKTSTFFIGMITIGLLKVPITHIMNFQSIWVLRPMTKAITILRMLLMIFWVLYRLKAAINF